jgi:hypothetical protein
MEGNDNRPAVGAMARGGAVQFALAGDAALCRAGAGARRLAGRLRSELVSELSRVTELTPEAAILMGCP